MNISVAILTVSDRCFRGEREDLSGKAIIEKLGELDVDIVEVAIVPDEKQVIADKLIEFCDSLQVNLVLTTGGTGLAPRDTTPEATKSVLDKEAPGFIEAIRSKSMDITDKAMLSRAASGLRNKTLIINLPGSPKAVKENLDIINPVIPHAIETMLGNVTDCGKDD